MQAIDLYVIFFAALLPRAAYASVWEAAVSAPLTPATLPTPCMSPSRPLPTPEVAAPTAEPSPDALRLQARVQDSEPAPPAVTPALGQVGADPAQLAARFRQTTYTSCVTHGTYVHCGVHEPILDAGGSSLGGQPLSTTVVRAILVAAVLGIHLVWA